MKQVLPYADSPASKREQISQMFDDISPKYDLLNHLLSFGIDKLWRRKVVRLIRQEKPETILDVATGTADLAMALVNTGAKHITGVDISEGMLKVGQEKIEKAGLQDKISLAPGDSENLQFTDNTFDAVTVSFGVRNFEHLEKGLAEMYRVLKTGGTVVVLEFSQPRKAPFKQIYQFYFRFILPMIGRMVSKNSKAYTYLPESVSQFPYGENFTRILSNVGFKETKCREVSFGIASIYTGRK